MSNDSGRTTSPHADRPARGGEAADGEGEGRGEQEPRRRRRGRGRRRPRGEDAPGGHDGPGPNGAGDPEGEGEDERAEQEPEAAPDAPSGRELDLGALQRAPHAELVALARELGVRDPGTLRRHELTVLCAVQNRQGTTRAEGAIEVLAEGYGILRAPHASYLPTPDKVIVSEALVRRHGLRTGQLVRGPLRSPSPGERVLHLAQVEAVQGGPPERVSALTPFEERVAVHPAERVRLAQAPGEVALRALDLLAPLALGQRGLIVAEPQAGRSTLLRELARAIGRAAPGAARVLLLIDERPEEVTEARRALAPDVEVVASTFEEPAARHVHVAEMVLAKAKRLAEEGRDVVVLLDSISRLARAYNAVVPHTGRTLPGGVDAAALKGPKRFFGAARRLEGGGSLTILAAAVTGGGSLADETVLDELRGAESWEVRLDRGLAERGLWPALDPRRAGARREDLLLGPDAPRVAALRRALAARAPADGLAWLLDRLRGSKDDAKLLAEAAAGV